MVTWYSVTVVVYSSVLERSTDEQRYRPASLREALRISSPSCRSRNRAEGVRSLSSRCQLVCARLDGKGQLRFKLPPGQVDLYNLTGSRMKTEDHICIFILITTMDLIQSLIILYRLTSSRTKRSISFFQTLDKFTEERRHRDWIWAWTEQMLTLLPLHGCAASYLCVSERETHFLTVLSQPQYGSLARTQSIQDEDLPQVASGICAAPWSEPAYSWPCAQWIHHMQTRSKDVCFIAI